MTSPVTAKRLPAATKFVARFLSFGREIHIASARDARGIMMGIGTHRASARTRIDDHDQRRRPPGHQLHPGHARRRPKIRRLRHLPRIPSPRHAKIAVELVLQKVGNGIFCPDGLRARVRSSLWFSCELPRRRQVDRFQRMGGTVEVYLPYACPLRQFAGPFVRRIDFPNLEAGANSIAEGPRCRFSTI